MRIVSLVPSWTETLIKAGVQVVGRTRFCIHPAQGITSIPIVGGTKEVDWDLIIELNPDLVILDKEENPLEIAEECPVPFVATHVSSLLDMQLELFNLSQVLKNDQLAQWALETDELLQLPRRSWSYQNIPGIIEPIKSTDQDNLAVAYMIWKKPWMSVSQKTFIGSVLEFLGARILHYDDIDKYPVLEIESLKDCFILYSSEPFPFHKRVQELRELGIPGAVVDGECYSWFGVRSLSFLKQICTQ